MNDRKVLWRAVTGALVVSGVAVAVLALRGSDGSAAAAPAAASTDHPGWWGGPWGGGPGRGGPWAGPAGLANALHGEAVVAKDGGGTETVVVQRGEVTDVNDKAVTVRSDDGFTVTYTVNGDTAIDGGRDKINDVAKTEQVVVTALKADHPTATSLIDLTRFGHR